MFAKLQMSVEEASDEFFTIVEKSADEKLPYWAALLGER